MATHGIITTASQTEPAPLVRPIPPLESGDRLSRTEFERRYAAMPWLKKAELIAGVVYVQAPVSMFHGNPHGKIVTWLGVYSAATPGIALNDNTTARLAENSELQPDACLIIDERCGGQTRIDKDGYIAGSPELAAEIAASSASYDLHSKLEVYRQQGVREYIVWRVYDQELDWFVLREGNYEPLQPGTDGFLHSPLFPGLWLDKKALLTGDLAAVLRLVQAGTASPEHAAFVERLRQAAEAK